MRVTFRPTVASDLSFCLDGPPPWRIKCITALVDDRIVGLGGIGFRPGDIPEMFVQVSDEGRKYPVALHRAGLMAMKMVKDSRLPMVKATTDADWDQGVRWLKRLGFTHLFTEDGKAVFIWKRE